MEIEISKAQLLKGQAIDNGFYKGTIQSAKCTSTRKTDAIDGEIVFAFEDPQLALDAVGCLSEL